jgi:hypothetical protein
MAIGSVQLLVLGFKHPDFQGETRQELDRLRDNNLVRVIDALGVRKDADGEVEVLHDSQLSTDQQQAFGALVGGLIGLGAAGQEGFELGAERGAEAVAERGGVFSEEEAWTYWLRSLRTPPGCWCCWSTAGRYRYGTPSRGRVACGWPPSSSAPSAWSRSGWCRPQRPKRWPPPIATRCEPVLNRKGA